MLPIHEIVMLQINKEMDSLRKALNDGNTGKARVCARRGAGLAVNYRLRINNIISDELPAMACLNKIEKDPEYPDSVKTAAGRLIAKVNDPDAEISEDPLHDCRVIVDYFMK